MLRSQDRSEERSALSFAGLTPPGFLAATLSDTFNLDASVRKLVQSINWSDFVDPQRFSGYVREIERHKSRNDCTSYEAVYIAELVEGKSPIGTPFANLYRVGQCWSEIEVIFVLFGNAHLNCIFSVEILDLDSGNVGVERVDSSGMNREKLVLVEIAKFIQLPKGVSLWRVRSLVRLNSIYLSPNILGELPQSCGIVAPSVPTASVPLPKVFGNREVDVSQGSPASRWAWPFAKPFDRGQTLDSIGIPRVPFPVRSQAFQFKPLDVASIIRVVLSNDGVRFSHVGGHVPIKSVKVKLCPFRFLYEIPCGPWSHFQSPVSSSFIPENLEYKELTTKVA